MDGEREGGREGERVGCVRNAFPVSKAKTNRFWVPLSCPVHCRRWPWCSSESHSVLFLVLIKGSTPNVLALVPHMHLLVHQHIVGEVAWRSAGLSRGRHPMMWICTRLQLVHISTSQGVLREVARQTTPTRWWCTSVMIFIARDMFSF